MGSQIAQPSRAEVWALAARQHGIVTRAQLLRLGFSPPGIKPRVAQGRLHPVRRGIYAVGRPQQTRHGTWMAEVLRCGPEALLSHSSAAALWEIRSDEQGKLEVSVSARLTRRRPGIVVHRRMLKRGDAASRHGIPVMAPACTLVDLAARLNMPEGSGLTSIRAP